MTVLSLTPLRVEAYQKYVLTEVTRVRTRARTGAARVLSRQVEWSGTKSWKVRFRSRSGRGLPRPERLLSKDAERASGYEVALKVEVVVDGSCRTTP